MTTVAVADRAPDVRLIEALLAAVRPVAERLRDSLNTRTGWSGERRETVYYPAIAKSERDALLGVLDAIEGKDGKQPDRIGWLDMGA